MYRTTKGPRALESSYVGLGPMPLPHEFLVANQKETIDKIYDRVSAACEVVSEYGFKLPEEFYPSHVISIVGGRGTGKTSVLLTALREIRDRLDEALTIDIIRPDAMSRFFPIIAAIVYGIEQSLEPEAAKAISKDKTLRLRQPAWALDVSETYRVISRDSVDTSEWTERLFDLLAPPLDKVSEFQTWLMKILQISKKKILVVPIDDADVSIEKAEEVINTLRTYLASPMVVAILAIDIPSLERRIRNQRLAELPPVPELREKEAKQIGYIWGMSPQAFQSLEAQHEQEYVENLMTKVMPPAARCYLADPSSSERLYKPFFIPGRGPPKSLLTILEEADSRAPPGSGVDLAPLIEKHPEILSSNLRFFINQLLMIKDTCAEYIAQVSSLSTKEKEHLMDQFRSEKIHLVLPEADRTGDKMPIPPIQTADQMLRSEFQMNILRSFLTSGDFVPILTYIRNERGIGMETFTTMQELVSFVLKMVGVAGTSVRNFTFRYQVGRRRIESSESNAIFDLCLDWALASGVPSENIADTINFNYWIAFQPVPIPNQLAGLLSQALLSSFEPHLKLIEGSLRGTDFVGPQVVVPADRDRLAPVFVNDCKGMGRYQYLATGAPERYREDALSFVKKINDMKKKDVRQDDIRSAFYRLLGLISIQSCYILNSLIIELLYDGDVRQYYITRRFRFTGNSNYSWILTYFRGLLEDLNETLNRKDTSLASKTIALSFVADLPIRILLACETGPKASQMRDELVQSIKNLLDQLSRIRLVNGRILGTLSPGKLNPIPSGEARDVFDDMSRDYPSLDWNRRWKALSSLFEILEEASFEKFWDSSSQPPKLWKEWADKVISRMRRKAKRKRKAKEA